MREPWATTKPWACTLKRREGKKGEERDREKMREPWITKPWACTLKREEGRRKGSERKGGREVQKAEKRIEEYNNRNQ